MLIHSHWPHFYCAKDELAQDEPAVVVLSSASDQTRTHDCRASPSARARCSRAAASTTTAAVDASRSGDQPKSAHQDHFEGAYQEALVRNDNAADSTPLPPTSCNTLTLTSTTQSTLTDHLITPAVAAH